MQQGPVGSGFVLSFMDRAGLEKCALQGDIIPGLRQGPGHDTQLSRPVEVIGYGARRDMQAEGDLPMSQLSLKFKAKNFFEFSHSDRPRRHARSSVGADGKVRV